MRWSPWSEDEVKSLNAYQACGYRHEFTGPSGEMLIATSEGWILVEGGPVIQKWAHEFMVDWSWRLPELEQAVLDSKAKPEKQPDPESQT